MLVRASANQSQDIDDLQKRSRLIEVSRRNHNEDSANTIKMQRQQIEKLKRDNDRLKEDLALETRQAKQANNLSASAQIAKLQDQGDLYTRKIDQEKRRIEELDAQIKKLEKNILQQRKEMGGFNASRENNLQVQKQIRILENRLDKALVKFNEALAHNKTLRETIENLRRERVVFDGIYRKLEKELAEKKQKMAQIIEQADAAFQQRDASQLEMLQLKKEAEAEQKKFEDEWEALGQMIANDRSMRDFMKSKDRERSATVVGDVHVDDEQKLRKKVAKGAWGIAKDKAQIHLSMERVQAYEEAFAKLQKATQISDIETLVQAFTQAEDTNFQLFNFVNDLSAEIEKLEEQISGLKKEISKYKGETADDKALVVASETPTSALALTLPSPNNSQNNANTRKALLQDLEQQLQKSEYKSQQYETKYQQAMKTVSALKDGIQSIFGKIGLTSDDSEQQALSEMLGNSGVTETNMMQYLGLIEQRVNELLYQYQSQRIEEDIYSSGSANQKTSSFSSSDSSSNAASTIQVPKLSSNDQNEEEDDEEVQPVDANALRAQIGQ